MHLVASSDSLGCDDLVPAACDSINVDFSIEELFAADGYGYVALLAYDVDGVTSVEFALEGWPSGRGAPPLTGPSWCIEGATTFGDHLASGGATGFGTCIEPDSTTGLILLGYLTFGPLDSTDVPIDLDFLPSTYTEPEDSLLAVTDCTEDFVVDEVVSWSGCTIGGTYSGVQPDCAGENESGDSSGADDADNPVDQDLEDLRVSFVGPRLQQAGRSFNIALVGSGLTADMHVGLEQGIVRRQARFDVRFGQVFDFRVDTEVGDRGGWDIVVDRGHDRAILDNALELVENRARATFEEFRATGGRYLEGVVGVKIKPWAFTFPPGQELACPLELAACSSDLAEVFDNLRVSRVEKVFPGAEPRNPDDAVWAKFYRLRFPSTTDVGDVLAALDNIESVMSAWCYPEAVPCAPGDTLHPNDPLYRVSGDTAQWHLHQWAQEYTEFADIDMPEAWGLLGTTTEDMVVAVIDMGLRYTHEDMGDTDVFPNWLSPCGYDVVLGIRDPMEEPYVDDFCQRAHGTRVSSVVAAATNNNKGIASVGWGTTKIAPLKICHSDSGHYRYHLKMPQAVRWAVDSCHVDAVNISYAYNGTLYRTKDFGAAVEYAHRVGGALLTASTGNGNSPSAAPYYPAAYPYVTGVTQTNRAGCWGDGYWMRTLGYPSTYCPLDSSHCDSSGALPVWLTDLAAPGGHFYDGGYEKHEMIVADAFHDSSYCSDSGTSLSAPLVAGVGIYLKDRACALGISLYPEDIEGLLCATADPVGVMKSDGTCWADSFYPTYPNTYCGWGKVNAYKAAERVYYSYPDPERQLATSTIRRFTATGYDSCWQDAEFEYAGYPDQGDTAFFYRHRLRKTVWYSGYGYDGTPHAWGYCASYANRGSFGDPRRTAYEIDPDEMAWKWSGVIPISMQPNRCTLESFLWCYRLKGSTDSTWVTIPPDSMVWGCGVSGWNVFTSADEHPLQTVFPSIRVEANYPNPFNPTTTIRFSLPVIKHVRVRIYDVRGRLVSTLADGTFGPGPCRLEWDGLDTSGRAAASGVYFVRFDGSGFAETRKMVLVR